MSIVDSIPMEMSSTKKKDQKYAEIFFCSYLSRIWVSELPTRIFEHKISYNIIPQKYHSNFLAQLAHNLSVQIYLRLN